MTPLAMAPDENWKRKPSKAVALFQKPDQMKLPCEGPLAAYADCPIHWWATATVGFLTVALPEKPGAALVTDVPLDNCMKAVVLVVITPVELLMKPFAMYPEVWNAPPA